MGRQGPTLLNSKLRKQGWFIMEAPDPQGSHEMTMPHLFKWINR